MLAYCWLTVYDVGPTVNQRWASVPCLLSHVGVLYPTNGTHMITVNTYIPAGTLTCTAVTYLQHSAFFHSPASCNYLFKTIYGDLHKLFNTFILRFKVRHKHIKLFNIATMATERLSYQELYVGLQNIISYFSHMWLFNIIPPSSTLAHH